MKKFTFYIFRHKNAGSGFLLSPGLKCLIIPAREPVLPLKWASILGLQACIVIEGGGGSTHITWLIDIQKFF